jgi:hypothetical protein
MRHLPTILLLLTAFGAAGCGTSEDRRDVREITERFYTAIREDDGEAACGALSAEARAQLESQSGRACDEVVTRLQYEGGDVEAVAVFVTNAKVDMSSGESAFLALEPDGWRLVAIGCTAETGKPRARPFECELEA